MKKLYGTLTPAGAVITATLSPARLVLSAVVTIGSKRYVGDYTCCSLVDGDYQLNTANRYLTDNITVEKIPYYESSNLSDGLTVFIGKDVEINYGSR